ncbi:MAG TPA: hypothetical protein VK808_03530 [Bacteroidia bacterium]|jgi:hypothetical protein|nr:hypothetical protein [Bacteroidia bacterium]
MKTGAFLLLLCFFGGIISAQTTLNKIPPTQDNSSIRKSERAQSRQTKEFQSKRSYSSMKGHGAKKLKQQSKNQAQGKGL